MPVFDVTIVGKMSLPEIGGGPIIPAPQPPLGIWGPTDPRPTPPIYIPVPPPPDSGLHPEHPIYIPVYPAHPIVLPLPPEGLHPMPPIYIPPQEPPLGIWGPDDPRPTPPIYIPVEGLHPEHPIYFPVEPTHPIVLPPEGETPTPPPDMIQPPSGAQGFWGYSVYYKSFVFVPYAGTDPISGSGSDDRPEINPLPSR